MRAAALRDTFCETQLDAVLADCGVPRDRVLVADRLADVDLDDIDLLVMSMNCCNVFGMLNGLNTGRVPAFVERGGICWILHQEREGWDATWLPRALSDGLHLDLKYLPKMISFRDNVPQRSAYIGPWLTEREHPLFHKPNFLDESDFAEWRIEHGGRVFRTAALDAVTRHDGWEVLAGYADVRTPLSDGALVMQARHGKGLYLWTQLLSPTLVWPRTASRERDAWRKLVENLLAYADDFRRGRVATASSTLTPWSVRLGEAAELAVRHDATFRPRALAFASGGGAFVETPFAREPGVVRAAFRPENAGRHDLRVRLDGEDGRVLFFDHRLTVVDDAFRCRFTVHHHYGNDWVTEHLGQVYGSARRWSLDAVFVASGLFYQSPERYTMVDEAALAPIDNSRVRFFPGQETHPHHQYGPDEGNGDVTRDSRRHLATMGCPTIRVDANVFEEDTLARIHAAGGLAIVAHPNPADPWWTMPHAGHRPDGVCLDTGAFADWDRLLSRGRLFPAVRGSDSGPGEWEGGKANTAWIRDPLDMRVLMRAAVNGRISFLYPEPEKFATADAYVLLTAEGQRMGGTLYASGSVRLRVRASSYRAFRRMGIVTDGRRGGRVVPLDRPEFDITLSVPVGDRIGYHRVELFDGDADPGGDPALEAHRPTAWTNPIFVHPIDAPDGGWCFFDQDPEPRFDPEDGRFVPDDPVLLESRFAGDVWTLRFRQTEADGLLRVGGIALRSCRLDGGAALPADGGGLAVPHGSGEHVLEIELGGVNA